MADFIKEIGHIVSGSPSWTNFELQRGFLVSPEPVPVNEKGRKPFGYGSTHTTLQLVRM